MKTTLSFLLLVHLGTYLGCATTPHVIGRDRLFQGERIRVSISNGASESFVGTFVALEADTLFWETHTGKSWVPFVSVKKLEFSLGRKSMIGNGAALGLLVGAGVGAVWGANQNCTGFIFTQEECVGIGAITFGVGGLFVGMLVGKNIAGGYIWEEIPLEKVRMSNLR